ncbi:hypothetical protein [Pseudomonas fragariae (ex Marin et al. 2024)]|uniref:hypothetical protein n=1 Tax=Pseudomonas fragariae (ex Marin et al. 2024) TaxID=3080056 RepID=UPI003F793C6B
MTEEEMRRALFGSSGAVGLSTPSAHAALSPAPPSRTPVAKPKTLGLSGPKVVVTLRVGNEFEGNTELFIHEAQTLSTLQAEFDGMKAARKKFKYVELVSVKPST